MSWFLNTHLFYLDIVYANASAPAIESQNSFSHKTRNQMPSFSHINTNEASLGSQTTQNGSVLTLRPEESKVLDADLCNICMSNPIDCLILECGHMATCLTCAKSLSKCPICRKQIVRLVKAFKS